MISKIDLNFFLEKSSRDNNAMEDNKEREECKRRECEREERHQAVLACVAECQRRSREETGLEKGQLDGLKSETYRKGDKNLPI